MASKEKFCVKCNVLLNSENISKSRYVNKRHICKTCIADERLKEKENENFKDGLLICRVCKEYKTLDNFTQNRNNAPRKNHDTRCNCCKQKVRNNILRDKDFDSRLMHLLAERLNGAKRRATMKNLPFDLTLENLLLLFNKQNGKCAISNIDMTVNMRNGRSPFNLSLDQIIPSKGYTLDNIQFICMAVNQLKSDFDNDVIMAVCSGIINHASKWKH